jgi:tetratricopeptide (TPR) repeat protein
MAKKHVVRQKQNISPQAGISTHSYLYQLIIIGFLIAVTVLTYAWSLHYDFQFDDVANIQKHFQLRHYDFFSLFFSGSRWISYWINSIHYSIGKFDPFSYRVGNLIIHTINGLLVFFVVLRMLTLATIGNFFARNAIALATMTALLFLLHPVQTQTVSYVIQGELEGLACMAIMSMVLCFLYAFSARNKTVAYVALAMLFIVAIFACGTKEIAIIAPGLLIIVDWFFIARGDLQSMKRRWWVHAVLMLMVVSIYMYFLKPSFFTNILGFNMEVKNNIGNIITHDPTEKIKPWAFFISQFKVILHYIGIFVWPFNMSVEYDWKLCRSIVAPDCIFPFMVLLALMYGVYRLMRKHPLHPIAFGAVWFFCCIAPRSSIIPSPELLVDYKTYTASIGLLFVIAILLVKAVEYAAHRVALLNTPYARYGATCIITCLLSFFTMERNKVWRSGKEFWWNIIENAPGKARAYNNYAVEIALHEGRYEEAIPYYIKAAHMDRNYPDPWNNMAVCYNQLGRVDEAIEALKKGLQIHTYYPEGHNNLASFYLRKKDYAQAEMYLRNALKLRPHYGKAYYNLGRLYLEKGETAKGLEAFKHACTIADLDNKFGYSTYAKAAFSFKEYEQAIWAFQKTVACDPHDIEALFSLGNSYYLAQKLPEAINVFKQVVAHRPDDARVLFNLGEAYFKLDAIDDALACFTKIEHKTVELPQIAVRIAGCYEKRGDLATARASLAKVLKMPVDGETMGKARRMLAQFDAQYAGRIPAQTA